jgi:hypothetical protein
MSAYNDGKQDSHEGTEYIPFLMHLQPREWELGGR